MREIKFRGKLISDDFRSIYKDGWIYGDYLKNNISHFIIKKFYEEHDNSGYPSIDITFWQKVIPETVGQFTGLYDKNGKEIYEGDILDYSSHWRWYVGFEDGCFRRIPISIVQRLNWEHYTLNQESVECWEIIGNIHNQ